MTPDIADLMAESAAGNEYRMPSDVLADIEKAQPSGTSWDKAMAPQDTTQQLINLMNEYDMSWDEAQRLLQASGAQNRFQGRARDIVNRDVGGRTIAGPWRTGPYASGLRGP